MTAFQSEFHLWEQKEASGGGGEGASEQDGQELTSPSCSGKIAGSRKSRLGTRCTFRSIFSLPLSKGQSTIGQ